MSKLKLSKFRLIVLLLLSGNIKVHCLSRTPNSEQLNTNSSGSKFSRALRRFDWNLFKQTVDKEVRPELVRQSESLMTLLQDFVILEPKSEISSSCYPPELEVATTATCSSSVIGTALTGSVNPNPPRIGILVLFQFDVDVLEIYLNEVYDVVDRFFIFESQKPFLQTLPQKSVWAMVIEQKRFSKFLDKVVHIVLEVETGNTFPSVENDPNSIKQLEQQRWVKFLDWNNNYKYFRNQDLIGFADSSQIVARKTIQLLKHCSMMDTTVDVGLWLPFRRDWPVTGYSHTYEDPTFFTVEAAENFARVNNYASRRRIRSGSVIMGGIQVSDEAYLPLQLINGLNLNCKECNFRFTSGSIDHISQRIKSDELQKLESELGIHPLVASRLTAMLDVKPDANKTIMVPWFYACNRNRYPGFEGKHDSRLD